jgi:hypothetical protein
MSEKLSWFNKKTSLAFVKLHTRRTPSLSSPEKICPNPIVIFFLIVQTFEGDSAAGRKKKV